VEEGDLILFGADAWETACGVLGRVRLQVAALQKLPIDPDRLDFLWVVDFPLLQFNAEDRRWYAVHHPFTRPKAEDRALLGDPPRFGELRAEAYDVVLNGVEIGGGSIRIHEGDLQSEIFSVLGITAEEQEQQFGHILRAFRHGAPPHGGLALGLDRLVALIAREESIREVIAFPKNNRGIELMTGSPSTVDPKQIRELYISSTVKQKPAGA
jgi:aspartyl-tRNA synthetase